MDTSRVLALAVEDVWGGPRSAETVSLVLSRLACVLERAADGDVDAAALEVAVSFFTQVSSLTLSLNPSPGCGSVAPLPLTFSSRSERSWAARVALEVLDPVLVGALRGEPLPPGALETAFSAAPVVPPSALGLYAPEPRLLPVLAAFALGSAGLDGRLPAALHDPCGDPLTVTDALRRLGGAHEVLAGLAPGWEQGPLELAAAASALAGG